MINEGTKVVCINDVIFYEVDKTFFTKNNQYEIDAIEIDEDSGFFYVSIGKILFYLEKKVRNFKKFSDHFITLAEWRQQQIDKILEDD